MKIVKLTEIVYSSANLGVCEKRERKGRPGKEKVKRRTVEVDSRELITLRLLVLPSSGKFALPGGGIVFVCPPRQEEQEE